MEDLLWPDEKPTWTAGAILLAADALTEHTAASKLFCRVQLLAQRRTREAPEQTYARSTEILQSLQQAQAVHPAQSLKQSRGLAMR